MEIISTLQKEFQLKTNIADNIVRLIDEGNTIPFIARYLKEQTDSMDDQTLRDFSDRLTYLRNLEKRKEEIITSITAQEKMTDELASAIEKASTLAALEDIYRPYRPKRRTRASIAAERGLTPLAQDLKAAAPHFEPLSEAAKYIDPEKEINTAEEALQGANDIIAGLSERKVITAPNEATPGRLKRGFISGRSSFSSRFTTPNSTNIFPIAPVNTQSAIR